MFNNRMRQLFFWATLAVVAVVIVAGLVAVLRILIRRPTQVAEETSLIVQPADVTVCQRAEVTFSVDPPMEGLEWAATGGGEIMPDGRYIAGELPGDYEVQVAGEGGVRGRAVVHIIVCTPMPTPRPAPTATPPPTPTTPPTPILDADPQGDVGTYSTGAEVASPPAGLDIRNSSAGPDRRVPLVGAPLPPELEEWAQEGEAVFWIALYEPIPEEGAAWTSWLLALDMDGNQDTGRPVGSARINPDLGVEVAIGLDYDPDQGSMAPSLLIWNTGGGTWGDGPTDQMRFYVNEERTLVGVAIPLSVLEQEVARLSGVTIVPDSVLGRAAAVAYIAPEAVIDFCPDLP